MERARVSVADCGGSCTLLWGEAQVFPLRNRLIRANQCGICVAMAQRVGKAAASNTVKDEL